MSSRIDTLFARLRAHAPNDAGKDEPAHDHFDVRSPARTAGPEAITIDRELMPGAESLRAIRTIERLLMGGTC